MSYLNVEYCRQTKEVAKKPSEPNSIGEHSELKRRSLSFIHKHNHNILSKEHVKNRQRALMSKWKLRTISQDRIGEIYRRKESTQCHRRVLESLFASVNASLEKIGVLAEGPSL